jgi:hypothetical protein
VFPEGELGYVVHFVLFPLLRGVLVGGGGCLLV